MKQDLFTQQAAHMPADQSTQPAAADAQPQAHQTPVEVAGATQVKKQVKDQVDDEDFDLGDLDDDDEEGSARLPPDCFERHKTKPNCSYLFEALCADLAKAGSKSNPPPARQINSEGCAVAREAGRPSRAWDPKLSDGADAKSWGLAALRRTGAKGGAIELRTAANRWRWHIYVLQEEGEQSNLYRESFPPKSAIWLWFSKSSRCSRRCRPRTA